MENFVPDLKCEIFHAKLSPGQPPPPCITLTPFGAVSSSSSSSRVLLRSCIRMFAQCINFFVLLDV